MWGGAWCPPRLKTAFDSLYGIECFSNNKRKSETMVEKKFFTLIDAIPTFVMKQRLVSSCCVSARNTRKDL